MQSGFPGMKKARVYTLTSSSTVIQMGFQSGAEGIRTLVSLRTNGFQDRLVMTASIPLRICSADLLPAELLKYIIAVIQMQDFY
jgi:hypothetical protein